TPHIPFVKSLATPISVFDSFLSNLIATERKAARNPLFLHQQIAPPVEIVESQPSAEPEKVLTLLDAWAMYKDEKGRNWTKSISMANERFIEVLMIVLGAATDVTTITKQDIKQ
ncbi:integrase, partial [Escherichia sp. SS-MK2]